MKDEKKISEEDLSNIFCAKEDNALRPHAEKEHELTDLRNKFIRDRDRIIYSKAFRRLNGKTQVFLTGNDDHIRNRMTHTLEVSQIARTISKELGLNVDLTEAIALGHDLGHTPFGHVGERTLNLIMSGCENLNTDICLDGWKGFKHNWQGVRVVMNLEKNKEYEGLNLTNYTMWGILNHSNIINKECKKNVSNRCMLNNMECNCDVSLPLDFYTRYKGVVLDENITVEGIIVSIADEIAQRHHDVEDALEEKIVGVDELISQIKDIYKGFIEGNTNYQEKLHRIEENKNDIDIATSMLSSFIVNMLTWEVMKEIKEQLVILCNKCNIKTDGDFERLKLNDDFRKELKKSVGFSKELKGNEKSSKEMDREFQEYISKRILNSHKVQSMDGKGSYIIIKLFKAYMRNPQQLPDKTILKLFDNIKKNIGNGYLDKCYKKGLIEKKLLDEYYEKGISKNNGKLEFVGIIRNLLEILHYSDEPKYRGILMRTICDYIAGMTDNYAMQLYFNLYQTKDNR